MTWIRGFELMTMFMLVVYGGMTPFEPPNVTLGCHDIIARETTTYRTPRNCSSVMIVCYMETCPRRITVRFGPTQSVCFGHPFYGLSNYSVSTLTRNVLVSGVRHWCLRRLASRDVMLTFHGNGGQVVYYDLSSSHDQNTIQLSRPRSSSLEDILRIPGGTSTTTTDAD